MDNLEINIITDINSNNNVNDTIKIKSQENNFNFHNNNINFRSMNISYNKLTMGEDNAKNIRDIKSIVNSIKIYQKIHTEKLDKWLSFNILVIVSDNDKTNRSLINK